MAKRLIENTYPETAAGGFTAVDGLVQFYARINALIRSDMTVLDFGAGRGRGFDPERNAYRRRLQHLQGRVARMIGADLDPAVLEHPALDEAVVLERGAALPFEDGSVDLIISDNTFEHVDDPRFVADELARIVKPGGWICARTPHKWGIIGLGGRLVPNAMHARVLRRLQPDRAEHDVFPTAYRMNTRRALRRFFPQDRFLHACYGWTPEPAYHGGSALLMAGFRVLNWLTPPAVAPILMVFIQKR